MLSLHSRLITYLAALLYVILGMFLFLMPESLAPVFAWKVTPFITMTIGGWCIGNGWVAFITARRWKWSLVYTALLYLWTFGVSELIVLFLFRAKLQLVHPIAWLYLATLAVNAIAAVLGIVDWLRLRPTNEEHGEKITSFQHRLAVAFVLFVGFLGVYGATVQVGALGTNGGIFPEIMSLFTLRSFGAFYLSIAIAAIPFMLGRSVNTALHHSYASLALIFFITLAAFIYIRLFDFSQHPGGLLYIGVYLIVGIPLFFTIFKMGTGESK
ncbi:MAG: hypothetical protein U0Z26_10180 [Anaerolineales bacterium]